MEYDDKIRSKLGIAVCLRDMDNGKSRLFNLGKIILLLSVLTLSSCVTYKLNVPVPVSANIERKCYDTFSLSVNMARHTNSFGIRETNRDEIDDLKEDYIASTMRLLNENGCTSVNMTEGAKLKIDVREFNHISALPQEWLTGLSLGLIPSWGTRPRIYTFVFEDTETHIAQTYTVDQKSFAHLLLLPNSLMSDPKVKKYEVYEKSLASYLGLNGIGHSITTRKPDTKPGPPAVKTDKATYNYGESVKVAFSGASGNNGDWICVVPAGSPDTEGGDYKYLPKGKVEGIRTFDTPAPGKYEVRAYYNYRKAGNVVAARTAFSVTGYDAYEKAMEERISRKLNPDDPLEAKVPSDKGVVYIVREPWRGASTVEVQILCNDKPVTMLANTDKYPFVVSSGECRFRTGSLFEIGSKATAASGLTGEATVKVKPGRVYYLKVKVVPRVSKYDNFLESVPQKEGAEMMRKVYLR